MDETHIQTIRGGIQRVMHLAENHWTQEPTRCGFDHHHEPYGYIPVSKPSKPVREVRNETWEGIRLALLREPPSDPGADGRTDAGAWKPHGAFHSAARNL